MPSTAITSQPRQPAGRLFFIATVCLAAFTAVILLTWAIWQVGGPVIPAATLKSLRGATKADVRRILGEPAKVMYYGDWIYERPLNAGYVAIAFDSDGTVRSVNDEQAEPQIFGSGSWQK